MALNLPPRRHERTHIDTSLSIVNIVLLLLFFFMIVVSLFPLGIGPETAMLRRIAPGVLWVAALLAAMLSLGRLFATDHQDGTLEQMALSPTPLAVLVSVQLQAPAGPGYLVVLVAPQDKSPGWIVQAGA